MVEGLQAPVRADRVPVAEAIRLAEPCGHAWFRRQEDMTVVDAHEEDLVQ
ncbi:hypothetical protein ACFWP5_20275 [Streptomyces sp. NPDC058469]